MFKIGQIVIAEAQQSSATVQFSSVFCSLSGNLPCNLPYLPDIIARSLVHSLRLRAIMPRKKPASWEGAPNYRWSKMIRGKRYRVTCRKLGLHASDWTKDRSWDAAKRYFDQLEPPAPEVPAEVKQLDEKLSYVKQHRPHEVEVYKRLRKDVAAGTPPEGIYPQDPTLNIRLAYMQSLGIVIPPTIPMEELSRLFGAGQVWEDRLASVRQVETSYTLRHQVDKFVELATATSSYATKREMTYSLNKVVTELGDTFDTRTFAPEHVVRMYQWCLGQPRSFKLFSFFKRFVNHLASMEVCRLPGNINSRLFKFDREHKAVKKYADELVIKAIEVLEGRHKLYALLALNTSMNNVDIANISKHKTWTENGKEVRELAYVDLEKGTLTRSRVKTKRQKNPPVTTYRLWPSTLRLLKEYQSTDERWFLTSMAGTKLHTGKKDLIGQQRHNLKKEQKLMTLKAFRSAGATAVGDVKEYKPYVNAYLANVPDGITDRHYDAGSQATMDEICDYLGRRFKQM